MDASHTASPMAYTVVQATNVTSEDDDSSSLSTPMVYAIITGSMFCAVVLLGLVNATLKNKTCKRLKDEETGAEPTERWVSPKAQSGDTPKPKGSKAGSGRRSSRRKTKLAASRA
ncbi:hypothetical protein NP493_239g04000 [Ridgeia piscesae]|uniref:Transmembrane protein n=1 Tax=Ridgeia piscesae TaxID=27915 RepID=A0AAD9NZJ1_RIDPI|nr:hypothetical protein NP493_239g04000 [Ridgeia piscesae]